jgi:hypothetical protein
VGLGRHARPGVLARLPAPAVPQTYSPLVTGNSGVILFVGDPQPVEIHHRGIWFSGELLGWTTTDEDRVLARVRCVVDGLRHSTWKDLAELRLPDPAHPPRRETFPAVPVPSGAGPDDDDATRPHVLLAGRRSRPQKPPSAQTPPPVRDAVLAAPPLIRPALRSNPNRRRSDELSPV